MIDDDEDFYVIVTVLEIVSLIFFFFLEIHLQANIFSKTTKNSLKVLPVVYFFFLLLLFLHFDIQLQMHALTKHTQQMQTFNEMLQLQFLFPIIPQEDLLTQQADLATGDC